MGKPKTSKSRLFKLKFLTLMELFNQLEELVNTAKKDAQAFYEKGNKAAGTRLRKAMMDAKTKAQDIRKDVLEVKAK